MWSVDVVASTPFSYKDNMAATCTIVHIHSAAVHVARYHLHHFTPSVPCLSTSVPWFFKCACVLCAMCMNVLLYVLVAVLLSLFHTQFPILLTKFMKEKSLHIIHTTVITNTWLPSIKSRILSSYCRREE